MELICYRFYEPDLLLLNHLPTPLRRQNELAPAPSDEPVGMGASLQQKIQGMLPGTEKLYLEVLAFAEGLGEDVSLKFLKHYIAMTRMKNFACMEPTKSSLKIHLNLDPATIELENGFSRDVTNIGHHGTGCLELDIKNSADLQKAFPLIERSYLLN